MSRGLETPDCDGKVAMARAEAGGAQNKPDAMQLQLMFDGDQLNCS